MIKLNRESILVGLSALTILIGLLYYGDQFLVQPYRTQANDLETEYHSYQKIVKDYPTTVERLKESENEYLKTEEFLPIDAQANNALVRLEKLANQAGVTIIDFSQLAQEEVDEFGVDTYSSQFMANSPATIKQLIALLLKEERVWKIHSFSYHQSAEDSYVGNIEFKLYYQLNN